MCITHLTVAYLACLACEPNKPPLAKLAVNAFLLIYQSYKVQELVQKSFMEITKAC